MTKKRLAYALAASLSAHAAVPVMVEGAKQLHVEYETFFDKMEHKLRREMLLNEAREQLREGKLKLGEFILKANALDAEEEGKTTRLAEASAKYETYLANLMQLLSRGFSIQQAVPQVLEDLNYHGIPGGRMSDAILEEGGSCEQIGQLVASLVYDAGYGEKMYLRAYVGHLAPTFIHGNKEYDLSAGGYLDGGGVRFHASELVEAYARAHGLAAVERQGLGGSSNVPEDWPPGRPSGFSYPQAHGEYPGSVPLFAQRAINPFVPLHRPEGRQEFTLDPSDPRERFGYFAGGHCYSPQPGLLNLSPFFNVPRGVSGMRILVPPDPAEIERSLECIEAEKASAEEFGGDDLPYKALVLAHIAAAYREVYWGLKLLGKHELAKEARKRGEAVVAEAETLLGNLEGQERTDFLEDLYDKIDINLHPAAFAFLGKAGQDLLLDFVDLPGYEYEMWPALQALLINPETRDRAISKVERLGMVEQLEIIQFLQCVESTVELKGGFRKNFIDEIDGEFYSAVEAYGALYQYDGIERILSGFWFELGQVDTRIVHEKVKEAVRDYGLGPDWEVALMVYYGRTAIRPYTPMMHGEMEDEMGALEFIRAFGKILEAIGSDSAELGLLKRQIAYISGRNRFSMEVLEEAERLAQGD